MQRILFPLITSLLFSGSYIAGKYTTLELDPLTTTLGRFTIALVFLLLLTGHYRLDGLRISLRDIPAMMLLGVTGVVAYHYFFFSESATYRCCEYRHHQCAQSGGDRARRCNTHSRMVEPKKLPGDGGLFARGAGFALRG